MTDQNSAAQAAAQILTYLGYAQAVSMEPGADSRRDRILSIIESAMLSKLRAEGVQAGDERGAFVAWLTGSFPNVFNEFDAVHRWQHDHVSALAWKARAALASAPVADGAQPEPLFWYRPCPDGLYEGPHHNNSVGGKMLRDEKPGQWKPLYAAPQASEAVRIQFPAHLRKMWSGGEVQAWLDEHQGVTVPKPSAKGSMERYRKWLAEQAQANKGGAPCSCPSGDGSLRHPCAVHSGFEEQRSGPYQTLFTYSSQPCTNEIAWRFGEACSNAARAPGGDYIDTGLGLLKELQAKGYGIAALATQPADAPPTARR